MELYLMRHGEAEQQAADAEPSLTDRGQAAVERVAARLAALGLRPATLQHSGLRRARQTAEIVAARLGAAGRVAVREGLRPEDPVAPLATWLLGAAETAGDDAILLVAHLPLLGRLAARLVVGDELAQVVQFSPATMVKLVPRGMPAGYSIAWVLAAELA
jgi:phosphohistidine phosphatase